MRMNIMILFSQPWRTGGAETHVQAMIKGMQEHNVFLLINRGSEIEKIEMLKQYHKNLKIMFIQTRGMNILTWKKDLKKIVRLIKVEKISIISAQQRTAGIWAYYLYRRTGIPYTVTMHDSWHRACFKHIYAKIFPVVFVVSYNLRKLIEKDFGFSNKQIHLVHNGIDDSLFLPCEQAIARKKTGINNTEKIILHVSRLSKIKGAVSIALIHAMKYISKDKKLIIIGEGPLRNRIEKEIKSIDWNYRNRIEIRDFVENIFDWYNAADVLVGEGRVAIEALACRRPVVAIRNGNTFIGTIHERNIAYASKVNFDGNDRKVSSENLASEIENAFRLSSEEMYRISSYVKKNMSLEKMACRYLDVFKQVIDRSE